MLYVRGNNCDTDDAEYYVNHLMVAVLRELDGDTPLFLVCGHTTVLSFKAAPRWQRHDGMSPAGLSPKNRGSAWIA